MASARRDTESLLARSVVWATVVVFLAASVLAATTLLGGSRSDAGPYPRTPVAQAEKMAAKKRLQIGVSYGGRAIYLDDVQLAKSFDRAVALGARWVRTDLSWFTVEPQQGVYDWSGFDRVVAAAQARGLRVLPNLWGTPEWARRDSCSTKLACPPADMNTFADFAAAAAARYAGKVTTWQVWNEPNIYIFWTGPSPKGYARMLSLTADKIRAVQPDAKIVFGALAALPVQRGVIEERTFLRAVCDEGVCDKMDVLSYHPYTYPDLPSRPTKADAPWSRIADSDDNMVKILDSYGLTDVPIWITEFGAPTGGNGRASDGSIPLEAGVVDHVTEKRQAEIAFDSVATAVVTPRVKMLVWYTDVDLPNLSGKQAHYGLRRANGTAKPAWRQLQQAITLFTAPPR